MKLVLLSASFAIAVLGVQFVGHFCSNDVNPGGTVVFMQKRIEALFQNIREIESDSENTVLVWGASEVETSLDPQDFEAEFAKQGRSLKVFNLGLRSMDMEIFGELVSGFQNRLRDPTTKFKASVIKLPIGRITKTFAKSGLLADTTVARASAADWKSIRENFFSDVDKYLSYVVEKFLWSFGSPRHIQLWINMRPLVWDLQSGRGDLRLMNAFSIWIFKEFSEQPEWSLKSKGLYTFNRNHVEDFYQRMLQVKQQPLVQERIRDHFQECCGVLGLDIDPILIQQLTNIAKTLRLNSERVILAFTPEAEDARVLRSPEAVERLLNLEKHFADIAGITVVDWNDDLKAFGDRAFLDFLHLSQDGWRLTYPRLVESILEDHDVAK